MENEEIEESMDSDSVSEDADDEGPTAKDEDPTAEDEGLTTGVKGPGIDDEGYGLDDEGRGIDNEGHSVKSDGLGLEEEEEAAPGGVSIRVGVMYIVVLRRTGFLDWPPDLPTESERLDCQCHHLDSLHLSNMAAAEVVGSSSRDAGGLIGDHTVQLEELSPALFERYDRDIGELFTRSGRLGRRFSPRGQTDAQRAALWHVISDVQGENRDLRLQLAEKRRARLELAEIINGMRRGQEPRGGDIVGRFWNGLPSMGRAEMVDQARFAWGFLSVFGNANPDRFVITSRTGSYPDTRLRLRDLKWRNCEAKR
ncbi:hypothetical protein Tco_1421184 [Tanacetum coccineum]